MSLRLRALQQSHHRVVDCDRNGVFTRRFARVVFKQPKPSTECSQLGIHPFWWCDPAGIQYLVPGWRCLECGTIFFVSRWSQLRHGRCTRVVGYGWRSAHDAAAGWAGGDDGRG